MILLFLFEGRLLRPLAISWMKSRTISTSADNNRITLNITKTKSLLITTLQKRRTLTSSALNIQIDGRSIEQVDYANLLGVMIDSDMSWDHHIDTICCIISSRLSLFRRIKPYLNFNYPLRFYNSCVNSYFIYCSAAWGTVPTISSYDSFVFKNVLGVYSWMPTSLGHLFLYFKTQMDPRFFISLNTGNLFFFSSFSSIWMLPDSCGPLGRFRRASLYDLKAPVPHSNSGKRTLVLPDFSMILVPTWKSFLPPLPRWFPNFLLGLWSPNYKVCFSHAYPRPSTWRNFCARLAAILLIVTVFHSLTTTITTSFNYSTYLLLFVDWYIIIYVFMYIYLPIVF